MSGFQFIHVECYARRASTKQPNAKKGKETKARKVKLTASEVAAEADREPDATPHIEQPKPPQLVYGTTARAVVLEAEKRAEASKDVKGRKIRADTAIMLAGVASHPFTPEEVAADPAKKREYETWRKLTVDHLQRKYGTALKSVVEHSDERHMHLHFYAIPEAGVGFNAKSLHDGFEAAKPAKDAAEQKRLYTEAMRQMQDRYFEEVGARCAQARTGPKRERLSREDWNQRQREVQQLSRLMRGAKAEVVKARKMAAQIIEQAKAKARQPSMLLSSLIDGFTGRAKRQQKEHEERLAEERKKLDREARQRKEAEAERDNLRRNQGEIVERHVALKMRGATQQLAKKDAQLAEQAKQLDALSSENNDMRQQLQQQRRPALTK